MRDKLKSESGPWFRTSRRELPGYLLALLAQRAGAQEPPRADASLRFQALPSSLGRYAAPIRERLGNRGAERGLFSGQLTLPDGKQSPFSWIGEFPGKIRFNRSSGGTSLAFDPARGLTRTLDPIDDELLEMLSSDTSESFFHHVQGGYVPRFLGDNFTVAGVSGFGARVDIFEHAIPVTARNGGGTSVKHFMFDSQTGLLSRVAYSRTVAGKFSPVLTQILGYERMNGYLAPQRIVRRHGPTEFLSIDLQSSTWAPGQADNTFVE